MPPSDSQTFLRELDKKLPALARWKTSQNSAKLPAGTGTTVKKGKSTTDNITSTGRLIDDALEAVEKENLNGAELIPNIPYLHAKDVLDRNPNPPSAPLGDLCAFAVKKSTMPILDADFVTASPPFNIKEWWDAKLEGDARRSRSGAETAPHALIYKERGRYGTPPQGNANFARVQHVLHHLASNGSMPLLLANGSIRSNRGGEGEIRRALLRRISSRA